MICHNARITKKASETESIDEMDKSSTPMVILMIVLIIVVLLNAGFEAYAAYKYKGQVETSKVFSQCLNGVKIDTGEGVITCTVEVVK